MGEVIQLKTFYSEIEKEDTNFVLKENEKVWRCGCRSILFFLTPEGAKCKQCGIISSDWVEE